VQQPTFQSIVTPMRDRSVGKNSATRLQKPQSVYNVNPQIN